MSTPPPPSPSATDSASLPPAVSASASASITPIVVGVVDYEARARAFGSDDFREGLSAFRDKRPPRFGGR